MKSPKIFSTITLALFISLSLIKIEAQSSAKAPSIEEKIDKIFAEWDNIESPGATVAVAKDGKIVFSKGYGAANLEYDIPNTPSTIFHIASVSKQFTAFSILLLATMS